MHPAEKLSPGLPVEFTWKPVTPTERGRWIHRQSA